MIIDLPNLDAMEALGHRIADKIMPGDVVALSGSLGTGKTTLARAILKALGHDGEVPSPTFTIVETYESPPLRVATVHADFYRLERPEEAQEIGLDDYREGAALIAEWPQNAGGFDREPGCLSIALEVVGQGRRAIAHGGTDWVDRMP